MEQLAMLYEEANSIFAYRDGEPPSKRSYDYLCRNNVVKPYEETAMQCAVKHLIGRAWDLAGGGSSSDALSRASDALDDLIEAFNELVPQEDGGE